VLWSGWTMRVIS